MPEPLHPDLDGLAWLLGDWVGGGRGIYPTISDFDYTEQTSFAHDGEPIMRYAQRTWLASGAVSHSETGFWRPHPGGGVDVTLAHPLGLVEVSEGLVRDGAVELESTLVARTPQGASPVVAVARRYEADRDELVYELRMQTEATALALHLSGRLRRA
jgi:hypothetical protein